MLEALGLVLAFLTVVVLVMKKINYGLALTVGAVLLGVFSGLSHIQLLHVLIRTLTERVTLDLAIIVSLIPVLAYCMKETGMIDDLIDGVKRALTGRSVLAILPALMGALPMLGGALLSAPLIDDEAEKLGLDRNEKSFVNVWFRHWNFFIYPLSSPLILVAGLTGFSIYTLIFANLLPVILYVTLGYIVSIRKLGGRDASTSRDQKAFIPVFVGISPILLTVILNLLGLHMALALSAGILLTFILRRYNMRGAVKLLWKGFDWRLPFAILGVMYFRTMVEYTDIFSRVFPILSSSGIPLFLLLILMAWTIGLATAMPSAGIAMIFPVALTSQGTLDLTVIEILYSTLIFGYLISPMHLCLILTVEYYKAHLHTVYRKLIPTALVSYLIFVSSALTVGRWIT
ncbi:DUF401 family protein [Candidatus Bathyarchaeota archaeon]|nr:MAG: DUF401 family protein [Candidatus Bathyarchaeota archaeon]